MSAANKNNHKKTTHKKKDPKNKKHRIFFIEKSIDNHLFIANYIIILNVTALI